MNKINGCPLVSIISPTFNHERYISDCIESVINQTYQNWEMIIIDDGSTDKSPEIIAKYARIDSRINYIRQENIGIFRLAETYNKALSLSTGQYIAILEGDDFWDKNKLHCQLIEFEKHPDAVLSWGKAYSMNSEMGKKNKLYPVDNPEELKYFENEPVGSILNIFLFRNCIPALTIIIRRDSLLKIGGFLQKYNLPLVDLPTLYELAMIGRFIFIPYPLGTWRIYPTQITKTYTSNIIKGFKLLALEYYSRINGESFLKEDIIKSRILNHYKRQQVVSYSRSGRYKLIRKDFKGARKDYLHCLFNYGLAEPIWKLRAVAGLFFSFFRMDIEWLAKLLGKDSYK
jgi:glycosyltransferase involved in cell wall biosynthesis